VPQLQQLETLLEQAGLVRHTANGLHLTTRGLHQIGANMLHDMFRRSPHAWRPHASWRQTVDLTGETKPYEFGDNLCLDLGQTLAHATRRGDGLPIRLHPEDFEVYRYEPLTQQATALILDMSHSMERFGPRRFAAAKKVALALAQLIRTHFPRDLLYVVGFGDTARQLRIADLPYATVTHEHTNTQAGLQLARRLLGRQCTARKQMVLITDGRPTAARHDGQLYAHTWDLHPVILHETFKEAKRCRQQHITLNTFMLADDVPLIEFVQQLTAVSHGRAFYTTPERLGRYVIEDYVSNRKRRAA
jgi:Ca-activated chloride channel homolog